MKPDQQQPPREDPKTRGLRRTIKELQRENRNLKLEIDDRELVRAMLKDAIDCVGPIHVPPKIKIGDKRKARVSQVQLLSDFHVGLSVEGSEIEGLNRYNWQICQARAWRLVEATIGWAKDEGQHQIEELVVPILGDMVNGFLREESIRYDEFEPPVQMVRAGTLIGEMIREWAGHFPKVRVFAWATDNHSRMTKKVIAAGRGKWSLGWTVNEIARQVSSGCTNVEFVNVDSIKQVFPIQGWRFLGQHGNDFRSWMGLPFYGMRRAHGNEALARQGTGQEYDFMVTGHFHQGFWLPPNHIGNGSLCGLTAHDHAEIRATRPAQVGFLVHPSYGFYNLTPFGEGRKCPRKK